MKRIDGAIPNGKGIVRGAGPVATVVPFDTVDEAIAMANATRYGLNAGIFTSNASKMSRMKRRSFSLMLDHEIGISPAMAVNRG